VEAERDGDENRSGGDSELKKKENRSGRAADKRGEVHRHQEAAERIQSKLVKW
jgi:hypothetical protein